MTQKEEYAIVLDYLPYGYPLEGKMMPVAQAIGEINFTLLQLIPRKGVTLELKERVYIGEGKRDKIYYIYGRLPADKLTENSKLQLDEFILNVVGEKEKQFVDFFNNSTAINTRMHQIELLPGYGKKHMKEILEQRKEKEFESFDDIKKRIPNIPDPKTAVQKRIVQELTGEERHRLFVFN
jgi:putative nucleotide binding protein